MKLGYINILITISCLVIIGCSEKISYSGKLINSNINYKSFSNKDEVIQNLGLPNYTDWIDNNFYYFSEKISTKNFYDIKLKNRNILVFQFDKNDKIINIKKYDANDQKNIKINKMKTDNNLIKRGLIQKLFGGIGTQPIPDTF